MSVLTDRVLAQFEDVQAVPAAAGAAWTAREAGGGRRVRIKKLAGDTAKTRATQALSLQHPRIVPTRRWMADSGALYVVRDFVPGRNLAESLAEKSQRAFDRLHARLLPLLDALDYAHAAGLAHGAVRAENILAAEQHPEFALLSDFAAVRLPAESLPRMDFAALCGLYKEFLPARPAGDEAGAEARTRLLRNLTETQETTVSADELRYKLDAIARMAALLGFNAGDLEADATPRPRAGSRLVCAVSPPTATVAPGGGTSVTLSLDNEGDSPLHLESVTSDAIWLNLPNGFTPVDLDPGTGGDLVWTVSAARLTPGAYSATLSIKSSDGSPSLRPLAISGDWAEQKIALPVLVQAAGADAAAPEAPPAVPLAERLPPADPPQAGDLPGIACVQQPDPAVVRGGSAGVVHIGVQNIGPVRLRIEKIHTRPKWLTYPGDLRAVWVEPGETRFLGFALDAVNLAGGDYAAQITFTTTSVAETLLGPKPVWRDMACEVRVRVVRGASDALPPGAGRAGCVPALLTLAAGAYCLFVHFEGTL